MVKNKLSGSSNRGDPNGSTKESKRQASKPKGYRVNNTQGKKTQVWDPKSNVKSKFQFSDMEG